MSYFIKETDSELILERSLYDEPSEWSEWEVDEKGNRLYSQVIQDAEHYAFFDYRVRYAINKQTGKVTYLTVGA